MTCMVTISDLRSFRLHLVFSDFNIPLLLMFDKNILLVCNIIKHYLLEYRLYCFNIFLYCVYFWICLIFCP